MGIFKENYCRDLLVWFPKVHTLSASLGLFFFSVSLVSHFVLLYLCTKPDIHMHEFNNTTTAQSAVNLRLFVYTHGSVLCFPAGFLRLKSDCHVTVPLPVFKFSVAGNLTTKSFTSSAFPSHSIFSDHIGCTKVGCVAVSCFLLFYNEEREL